MAVTFTRSNGETTVTKGAGKLLAVAVKQFKEDMKKGTTCPCCGRYGKLNMVSLSRQMVLALNWIASEGNRSALGWADVQGQAPRSILRARSYMKLVHWGLIKRRPSKKGEGPGHTGFWRATDKGLQFLYGDVAVPQYVYMYNRVCEGTGGPMMFVSKCLQAGDLEGLLQR